MGGPCSDVEQQFQQVEKNNKREKLEELLMDAEQGEDIDVREGSYYSKSLCLLMNIL